MDIVNEYKKLNSIATQQGVVVFGEGNDVNIPVSELKQSFNLDCAVYNRSFPYVSPDNAADLYDKIVKPLNPDTLLLHVSAEYVKLPSEEFPKKYAELLRHIKSVNKRCRVIVISNGSKTIDETLKNVAESENCEYVDLLIASAWDPLATKAAAAFVKDMGINRFVDRQPVFDLIKIFFGFERTVRAF